MNYEVLTIPPFDKQLKKLAKKYPSLKEDFVRFLEGLSNNPLQGKSLGKNCFKIRLAVTSKGKGKSGGARVITHLLISEHAIFLLAIYDKGSQETLTDKELKELILQIPDQ